MQNFVNPCQFILKILSENKRMAQIKDHHSGTNLRKMTCNNSMLDLAKMNAYINIC